MTEQIITVSCPLSTLRTIANALYSAEIQAGLRANCIQAMADGYEKDPKAFPFPFAVDTVDCIPEYREAEAEYRHASNLAWKLFADGKLYGEPITDAEAPQTQVCALSELVPF